MRNENSNVNALRSAKNMIEIEYNRIKAHEEKNDQEIGYMSGLCKAMAIIYYLITIFDPAKEGEKHEE